MSFKAIKDFLKMMQSAGTIRNAHYKNPADFILRNGRELTEFSPEIANEKQCKGTDC